MRQPRICFLGPQNLPVLAREYNSHGIGGEQVQQTLLAKALSKRGFDVSMVVADYGQPDGAVWDGVRTIKSCSRDDGIPVLRSFHPRLTSLWGAMRRANADIYYTSCAGRHVGVVAEFTRRYGGSVMFRVAHDFDCEPENLLIRYWWDKRLYEWGLRRVDTVMIQTEQQAEALRANYGVEGTIARMLVEPGMLDLGHSERTHDVLWVNNLRQFKRPDLLVELAEMLGEVSFDMIGGPLPGHAELFRKISERASTMKNLEFHGRVPYHDVNDFYERAKVFVNTSDSEGFPNSYLQAWARGTPVIAFFDPDGVIAREGLGYVPSSLRDMAQGVRELVNSPEEWRRMSLACKQYMKKHYDEDTILAPYLSVIEAETSRDTTARSAH